VGGKGQALRPAIRQRVRSEAIGSRGPSLAPPDGQYDNLNQGDEGEQKEPAGAVGVMQSPRRNRQVGQQQRKAGQAAERRHYRAGERNKAVAWDGEGMPSFDRLR